MANISKIKDKGGTIHYIEDSQARADIVAIQEQIGEGTGGGLDETAQALLISILSDALYTKDHSEDITALERALSGGKTLYSVTYTLNGATSSNTKTRVAEGSAYNSTISAGTGYSLIGVTVSMGGRDITSSAYSNGNITIASVTGDISIIATADAEMVALKSINLSNGAYVDTEYLISSYEERYLLGAQFMTSPGSETSPKAICGVTRRPSSTTAADNYLQMYFASGTESRDHSMRFYYGGYRAPSVTNILLRTANGDYDADRVTEVPFYFSAKSGQQRIRANEEMTESLRTSTFATVNATTTYSSTAALPIDPIYIGKCNNAGAGTSGGAPANFTGGVKFYCFKVYDANGTLVVNMKPMIRGSEVGMYDLVRGQFYVAHGTVGTDITYDEVDA